MFWWILSIVLFVVALVCFVINILLDCSRNHYAIDGLYCIAVLSLVFGIVILFSTWGISFGNKQYVNTWNQKKIMYETMATDDLGSVSIKQTIVDRNEVLINTQYFKVNAPFFSLCPDEVLELEPIKIK